MQSISFVATPGTPQECASVLREQVDNLAKVVTATGLKPK
jgi:hypothetical protein